MPPPMQRVSVYEEHTRQVAYKWPQGGPTVQARRRSLTTFRATGGFVTHERGQDPEVDLTFYKVRREGAFTLNLLVFTTGGRTSHLRI